MQVGAGSIPGRSRSGFMKRTALYYVGSVAKWVSVDTCSLAAGHFGVTAPTILPWRQGAIIKSNVQVRDSCQSWSIVSQISACSKQMFPPDVGV